MTDIIQKVRQFTEAVGCTTDQFNVRQTALYIGLQLEEMAEKLEALLPDKDAPFADGGRAVCSVKCDLETLSGIFKRGELAIIEIVKNADRAAMLDADIDLAWVTIGSALSQGADVEGAAGEVARANLDKLVECHSCTGMELREDCRHCNGTGLIVIKDANGKVRKPTNWVGPDIEPFVCKATS